MSTENSPMYTITPETAATYIDNWKHDRDLAHTAWDEWKDRNKDQPVFMPHCLTVNAFTFKLDDLVDLLNRIKKYNDPDFVIPEKPYTPTVENPINAIRFYLGTKNKGDDGKEEFPCLVNVAVTNFIGENQGGKNLEYLPVAVAQKATEPEGDPDNSAWYDFSYPCPGTC